VLLAIAAPGTLLFSIEEGQAHALESDILNAGTQGRYSAQLNEVYAACHERNLWNTMAACGKPIAEKVDTLFNAAKVSESHLRAPQYLFEVVRRWYKDRGSKDPDTEAYQTLRSRIH